MDPADAEGRQRRLAWLWAQSYWGSQLIRKVYEVDPLLCPYCEAETYAARKAISYTVFPDSEAVKRALRSLAEIADREIAASAR